MCACLFAVFPEEARVGVGRACVLCVCVAWRVGGCLLDGRMMMTTTHEKAEYEYRL